MKILLCLTKYPDKIGDSYLTSELADEWAAMGHEVTVIAIQWEHKGGTETRALNFPSGVTAHYFSPIQYRGLGRLFERISRWTLSSYRLRAPIAAAVGNGADYDVAIFFAPVVTQAAQVADFATKAKHSYLYVTDFFPYAARNVGLVPKGPVFHIARWAENRLMRKFGTIGTMSPRNADYLRRNYVVDPDQRVAVDMIWGTDPVDVTADHDETRATFGLPADRQLLLFGGQLSEGRGVEDVIAAAEIAARHQLDLAYVVIGDGRLRPQMEQAAARLPQHLHYRRPVPRDRYLELAAACDAGLVVTVRDTDVPTFPSRTIDYLRVGLPIVAAVELSTDFGEIIADMGLGVHVAAGDPRALVDAALSLFADRRRYSEMRTACVAAARDLFNARRAARDMLDHAIGASA
ncbi:glycosyltransferase family 4 protein [Sphingopyxis terrae]|uniref:glycosyltransferase family 4 protein n=1 Tax=Sphingopyxis terrae TaxID=33052 RepID=UPI000A97C5D1|nr:glycosyltransferase family 4 protein [Sphingopyxis terrae]